MTDYNKQKWQMLYFTEVTWSMHRGTQTGYKIMSLRNTFREDIQNIQTEAGPCTDLAAT